MRQRLGQLWQTRFAQSDATETLQQRIAGMLRRSVLERAIPLDAPLPSTRELRESPRFLAYAESAGIARLWQTRGWPDGCVRVQAASGGHLNCSGMPE